VDTQPFRIMGYTMDIARRIERPEVVRRAISGMADCGYNLFGLYLEGAYAYPRHPALARKHAYSPEFMAEVQGLCRQEGMELMPIIPSLGHTDWITSKPGYRDYDEGRGTDQLCGCVSPSFPETYDLLTELYEDWCRHVPGEYLHVALDESPDMGQYHRRTHGTEGLDLARMFADHCNRLHDIVQRLGRRMVMWGDMFYYLPQAIPLVKKDIIVADWYYYHFPRMPRVETFNFEDVDSSRRLKEAGLEVWGVPSVWANYPFPDVRERWQNLQDWIRYGREVGIGGILNTDWENSFGFYSNADLLFRSFGRGVKRRNWTDVKIDLKDVLQETAGATVPERLVDDILRLGEFHLTGHGNRAMHARPLESLASAARQAECRSNYEKLSGMLADLPDVMGRAGNAAGKGDLRAIALCHQVLLVTWRLGAVLPECYRLLCAGDEHRQEVCVIFDAMAQMVETFAEGYRDHWRSVRFEDDPSPILMWAEETCRTLRAWADAAKTGNLAEHPLVARPRLEDVLKCRYPALPVMDSAVIWPDGEEQTVCDILIRFEGACAQPEQAFEQHSAHPLSRREVPSRIRCTVRYYGQIGIEKVNVVWRGRKYPYHLVRTMGEYATTEDNIVWLGPRKATPEMPMTRDRGDQAWFEMDQSENK
jgi:hypothetical protein